jgi:hypothetical protein
MLSGRHQWDIHVVSWQTSAQIRVIPEAAVAAEAGEANKSYRAVDAADSVSSGRARDERADEFGLVKARSPEQPLAARWRVPSRVARIAMNGLAQSSGPRPR